MGAGLLPTFEDQLRNVSPVQDPNIRRIVARALRSHRYFAQTFLSESFDSPMTKQNDQAWELYEDDTVPYAAVCAWRGFGKTTMALSYMAHEILYRRVKFVLIIAADADLAGQIADNLKSELTDNPKIREAFGDIAAKTYRGVRKAFGKNAFFLCDPKTGEPFAFVATRGAKQGTRGLQVRIQGKIYRPQLVYVDDVEDDDEIDNDDVRKKIRFKFVAATKHCIDRRKRPNPKTGKWDKPADDPLWTPPWRFIYQDTLKHEDANIQHILQSPQWKSLLLPQSKAVKENGRWVYYSCVEELLSHEEVRAEVRQHEHDGTMDIYARENMCIPVAPSEQSWCQEYFHYTVDAVEQFNKRPDVFRFMIADPGRTRNPRSCPTAILLGAFDPYLGRITLRHLTNERLDWAGQHDALFGLALEYNTRVIAVETTGLEEHISTPLENEAMKRKLAITWIWLDARGSSAEGFGTGKKAAKAARAGQIIPMYERGEIWHDITLSGSALEMQELTYPKNRRWDALDCAAYIPVVMAKMGWYFLPKATVKHPQFPDDDDDSYRWNKIVTEGRWRLQR